MTPAQLMSHLRELGPQDLNVVLHFLADHLYTATLANGFRLAHGDVMDLQQWLRELAEAARMSEFPEGTRFPESTKVHLAADSGARPKVTIVIAKKAQP